MTTQNKQPRPTADKSQRRAFIGIAAVAGIILLLRAPWSESGVFVIISTMTSIAVCIVVMRAKPVDVLAPGPLTFLFYGMTYAVGALWISSFGDYGEHPYFGLTTTSVLTWSALLVFVCFFPLLAGYLTVSGRRRGRQVQERSASPLGRAEKRRLIWGGVLLLAVGAVSYIGLISKAGGLTYFLTYSEGRADIFRGVFGAWFWGVMILFGGYCLLALALMREHPWLCLVAAVAMSVAFFPLQGRDLLVAPLFCWLTIFNCYRRVPWRTILVGALVLLTMSAFLGAFRAADKRVGAWDVREMASQFVEDWGRQVTLVVAQNIDQLESVMLAVRYIEKTGDFLGPRALLVWLGPIDRLFLNNAIEPIESGVVMDRLIFPEHAGSNTGLSPSLVGELYISVGWLGAICGMYVYGLMIGWLALWYDRRNSSLFVFAAYPFVLYMVVKANVDGTGQLFRALVVLSSVWLVSLVFSSSKSSVRVR